MQRLRESRGIWAAEAKQIRAARTEHHRRLFRIHRELAQRNYVIYVCLAIRGSQERKWYGMSEEWLDDGMGAPTDYAFCEDRELGDGAKREPHRTGEALAARGDNARETARAGVYCFETEDTGAGDVRLRGGGRSAL
jgi:hypothetical protein